MNHSDKDALRKLRKALKPFIDIDGAMTLNRVEAFLAVLSEDITDMMDLRHHLEEYAGITRSASSRMASHWGEQAYLQFLSDKDGNPTIPVRPEGARFLRFDPDPRDHRRRKITVTPQGEQFAASVAAEMQRAK